MLGSNIFKLCAQPSVFLSEGLWKANKASIFLLQAASIKSKAFKEPSIKPPPFPYKEKYYSIWRSFIDDTTSRLDENSKIVVVEGPVAVGKTKFARELANLLDMHHIREANMDLYYITPSGFDLRTLDSRVPKSMESFDEKKFCQNPRHLNAAAFQVFMYRLRYSIYVDALAHLLSTGQGVVIERSPWSDKVFLEAMAKSNFISKEARRGYYEVKRHTIQHILRPHLIIYLDCPVPKVKENIKKRGFFHEQNSPALSDKFLQDMEDIYKTDVLAKLSTHAELLMYDWSEEGDVEAIVEDIERIDFARFTKYDEKIIDWDIRMEDVWAEKRRRYADQKHELMSYFNVPYFDAPELVVSGEDLEEYDDVYYSIPQLKYEAGYNTHNGDSGFLFKNKTSKYVPY